MSPCPSNFCKQIPVSWVLQSVIRMFTWSSSLLEKGWGSTVYSQRALKELWLRSTSDQSIQLHFKALGWATGWNIWVIALPLRARQWGSDSYCSPTSWSLCKSQDCSKIAFIHASRNDLESFPPFFYILNSFYKVEVIYSLRAWYHLLLKHLCLFNFNK